MMCGKLARLFSRDDDGADGQTAAQQGCKQHAAEPTSAGDFAQLGGCLGIQHLYGIAAKNRFEGLKILYWPREADLKQLVSGWGGRSERHQVGEPTDEPRHG